MDYFTDFLTRTGDRMLTKWEHYFDVYTRELGEFRDRPVRFLEIGIFKGGSIPMWQGFFAPGSHLVFADIDPACRDFALPGTHVEIGDQADPDFLEHLGKTHGPFDLILDDGGHMMHQQTASLFGLWRHLADRGRYLVEDTHTSYWPGFGGGLNAPNSFIELSKMLVDAMHSWYTDDDEAFPFNPMAVELDGVRFYDSIVVLEKRVKTEAPISVTAMNGQVARSRKMLEMRGRASIF